MLIIDKSIRLFSSGAAIYITLLKTPTIAVLSNLVVASTRMNINSVEVVYNEREI